MIERRYSLRQASKLLGVSRPALKGWLLEAGLFFPETKRGQKVLIRERELELALRRRGLQHDLPRLRTQRGVRTA